MEIITAIDPELQMLINNEKDGYNYRERRHNDWSENYTLSRDRVLTNRLTQRQSVNLPVMKTTLKTVLKDIDDLPGIYFENLDNDKQAEVFKNLYWEYTGTENKFEILDVLDKKQVFHYGRTYDQWQVKNGRIQMGIEDPMDILVSRYTDPTNIHSSRFLGHIHIFRPLSALKKDPRFDKAALEDIEKYHATQQGLIKAADSLNKLNEKNEKMREMGVVDVDNPILGETYIELALQFVYREREVSKGVVYEDQIFLYIKADDRKIVYKEPLEKIIGQTKDHFWRNHYPYNSWADDVEKQDWYSDGIADIVRTPNKILNAWFSQLVENRTLKNLNMNIFNSKIDGFAPQTWQPQAWGMYGIPLPDGGKITDVFQQLPVADLGDSLDEMQFIVDMVDKATGASANQSGQVNQRDITLGEVKLALVEAKERIQGMSKYYTQVWKERGLMFTKLIEAAHGELDAVEVSKKGRNSDDIYTREISPSDWMTAAGYFCKVWDRSEKEEQDMQNLEKISAVAANIPGNPKLEEIKQRKMLTFAGLKPDEVNDVMEFERAKREALQAAIDPMTGLPMPNPMVDPAALVTPNAQSQPGLLPEKAKGY